MRFRLRTLLMGKNLGFAVVIFGLGAAAFRSHWAMDQRIAFEPLVWFVFVPIAIAGAVVYAVCHRLQRQQ